MHPGRGAVRSFAVRSTRFFGARRLVFRVRRNVPRAVAQPLSAVLPEPHAPATPILLVGCPRSGTTILLQALLRSGDLGAIQAEGHVLWDAYHPRSSRVHHSDELGAGDVSERERRYVYWAIRLFVRGRRFVDKTPESSLRVPYLDALFPDAVFVFLRRRAADNVNSLIEGWRARPRFVTYRLPEPLAGIAPLDGRLWSFVLVPGWRELRSAPLEEICARQYVACNEALLAARDEIEPSRWVDVVYEELVAAPAQRLRELFDRLGISFTREAEGFAASFERTVAPTALTPPRPDKWRDENPDAISRILPLVAATEERLGYERATR